MSLIHHLPNENTLMNRRYLNTRVCGFIVAMNLLFVLNPYRSALAQDIENIRFDRILSENTKIEKGLSQNSIQCMLQDRKGYIWFGTWDGLNKYDGYRFIIYDKENKLSGQTVNCLLEDEEGYLWIGTDEGLNRYDRRRNEFRQFRHDLTDSTSLVNDFVTALVEDDQGYLWVGTQNGLSRLDKKSGLSISFLNGLLDNTLLKSNYINDMCFDSGGFLWIATRIGLMRFDCETSQVTRLFSTPDVDYGLSDNFVRCIYKASDGFILVGTSAGLNRLNPVTSLFENDFPDAIDSIGLNFIPVNVVVEDSQNNLWVGTDGYGLYVYDPHYEKMAHYERNNDNINSLSNNRVLNIIEDYSGTIWVGTFIGVNKFDRHSSKFNVYKNTPNIDNSLNSNYVLSIFEDNNEKVWVATNGGLNVMDRKTGEFTYILHNPHNPSGLISNNLRVVTGDRKGHLWIGTLNDGVDQYDPRTGWFIHFRHDPRDEYSISSNDVLSIIEDNEGFIWIGTGLGGLNRFDPATNRFTAFKNSPSDTTSISSNQVWTIYQDKAGNLWIGTGNGLDCFDPQGNHFFRYLFSAERDDLDIREVFCIHQDASGLLWIGTKGGGLLCFNPVTGSVKAYTEKEGLSNNVVYGILEDKTGSLWLSTNWGLSRFNPSDRSFVHYDVRDGLQSNEFNIGAYFENSNGEMYFGGMNGFNLFNPSDIKTNDLMPRTVITSFRIFNHEVGRELNNDDTIVLSAEDNFFTIEFSALDYTNPYKNRYRYYLQNYDKDWTYEMADKRYADYTNVTPGTYLFNVKGSNNDGIWDKEGAMLTIIIRPHWYKTWWFRIPVIVLFILMVWYLISRRISLIRKQHEAEKKVLDIQKQLYDTELQALRLQMNPHFIFNTLNSIQSFILKNDTDKAVSYLGKFSQLMRLILIHSTETYISIKEELRALHYYLEIENLRFDNKFSYSITVDKAIDEEFMEIPPMIIQPYVENAILHGLLQKEGKGHIDIRLSLAGHHILFVIEDNGIGRDKAQQIQKESGLQRKSRGMLITMERLQVLNRNKNEDFSIRIIDLKDNNGLPSGTRVELLMAFID
jgi:ligand-binding sensor domain-containing protein